MKKHVRMTFVLIALGAATIFYFGCASQQNNANTNTAAMASPEPTPDKAAIEAELTRIENDWPRILKEHDAAAVRRVEADDIILVYPDGSQGSKERDLNDIESGALTADAWEVSDVVVKVLDSDFAVVTLRTNVKSGKYKTPDGKIQDISGQFRSVDTFAHRNGQWQLVGSASVVVANPAPTPTTSLTPRPTAPKPSPATKTSPSMKPSPSRKPSPRAAASPALTRFSLDYVMVLA